MNEKEKFIVRISCEPKIEPLEDFSTKLIDKMLTLRVEKVNESVISQLRDLMKEKGINELYAIDESKVLEMVKKSQALEIIKTKSVNVRNLIIYCFETKDTYEEYVDAFNYCFNYWELGKELLTQEEYDLLNEVLVCH